MGIFKSVGKFFRGEAGGGGPTPTQEVDPALRAQRDNQLRTAQNYRSGASNLKQEQGVQSEENTRQDLAQKLADVRSGANRRGLLYSGLRQGAERGAGSDAASTMASSRMNINNAVDDQANALDSQALNSAFQVQQMQQDLNDTAYQDALTRRKQSMGIMSMLGAGLGGIAGAQAGK